MRIVYKGNYIGMTCGEIGLVLIAYAQKPPINTKSGASRGATMVSKWPAPSYTSVYLLFANCEGICTDSPGPSLLKTQYVN